MNFFAHAVVASWQSRDPRVLLGAMLPDLLGMAGVRLLHAEDAELERGIELHHATDAAFHAAPAFTSLCADAIATLTSAGLERGTARAVGHVGVELLLDGALGHDPELRALYSQALAFAIDRGLAGRLTTTPPEALSQLAAGLARLASAPIPERYDEPSFVAERLRVILAGRPRLALRPGDLAHVEAWAETARDRVAESQAALLEQVRLGLERRAQRANG